MKESLMKKIKKKKGFTLIELIIVIAVIAIIAAFAIPNFVKVQDNAKKDADVNLGRTIAHAVEVMTTDATIGKGTLDADGKVTDKTLELNVDNTGGNPSNSGEADKIQKYINDNTLKLQTKGAASKLIITINEDGKVKTITEKDKPDNKIYPTAGGIYAK